MRSIADRCRPWTRVCLPALAWLLTIALAGLAVSLNVSRQRIVVVWAPSISDSQRAELEQSFGLARGERGGDGTWNYLLTDRSHASVEKLVTSPSVADTRHIDRLSDTVELDRPDVPSWLRELAAAGRLTILAWLTAAFALTITYTWRRDAWSALERTTNDPAWAIHRVLAYTMWVFVLLIALEYFSEMARGGNPWRTADWLMTYFYGPVRRGLIGTLLVAMSEAGLPLRWVVYGVQVLVFAIVVLFVLRMYTMRRREWVWLALLYSPAFLLFEYHDTGGALRKEILAFLALSLLCVSYAQQAITRARMVMVAALFTLAAFSHEVALFTLPFFLYIAYRSWKTGLTSKRGAVAFAAFLVIVSGSAALFAAAFKGDAAMAASLCESLVARGFDRRICSGSLAWLNVGPVASLRAAQIDLVRYLWLYLRILAVAVVPFWFIRWRGRERGTLAMAGLLCLFALFAAGVDWGRWIHVVMFGLVCVVLAESAAQRIEVKHAPIVLVLLYVAIWSVPLCCGYTFGGGFVGEAYR